MSDEFPALQQRILRIVDVLEHATSKRFIFPIKHDDDVSVARQPQFGCPKGVPIGLIHAELAAAKSHVTADEIDGAVNRLYLKEMLTKSTLDENTVRAHYGLLDGPVIRNEVDRLWQGPYIDVTLTTYVDAIVIHDEVIADYPDNSTDMDHLAVWCIVYASTVAGLKIIEANKNPHWYAERRELWFRGECCRSTRKTAQNQDRILEVFEEHNWPDTIKDPFISSTSIVSEKRLRDTIAKLNKSINPKSIRFGVVGCNKIKWTSD